MNSDNMSNTKHNKRIRSSSPDNYKEESINLISDSSLNILTYKKKNVSEINIDLEAEQINEETLIDIIDDSDEEMELKLHIGQSFQTWLDAEKFLTEYSLIKGFSIRQKRTEILTENGVEIIRKITWECCCAGRYQEKKVINPENQRNKTSKCTNCQWHVNGNLPKSSSNISFTTVVDEHNHQMMPSPSITIAMHRKLDESMIEFINFCVSHGTTAARNIRSLLQGQFPGKNINQKNLYNAIQIAKKNITIRQEYDASNMLQHLYAQKSDDPRWFIETKFDGPEHRLCSLMWMSPEQQHLWTRYHDVVFFDTTSRTNKYNMVACFFAVIDNCNRTRLVATALLEDETEQSFCMGFCSLFCLFHIDLNLKKNLRSKLTTKVFNEFRKEFFQCRNTLAPAIFETRWKNLKEKYSSVSNYLNRQLDPLKTKWAICYINIQFTAGANSTQCVESLNKKVHDSIKSTSSLLILVKEIQQLLDNEANFVRIQEYKDEIPSVGQENIAKKYFKSIEKIVSDYLLAPMTHSEDDYNEGVREDHYEIAKILLSDISAGPRTIHI
ncbi:hypothetical protein RclHR1_10960008 [Rhizophagus clarus]|uniref:Protein FAR1-related sequence 5-like n=1 Tax=Rhizophagus clarus TaxID=94130 RepID=A0A2Z6QF47_9GLOM|nr:hypothetical protein RclHR1_10960008 [Rhizophagus clarus]GES96313.1 protein FAR1-related sequence 5-like [Rhizophagus clarus]